ncbi:uncharacterized protein LOC126594317 [Malus sylvestris]|uniref:uncharacterized protein LOC126594317 n=1 Tax=Malus sylvestris TaxID=3752 RepID=UPI0021ACDC4C|nr:uncharacterized protein LOC126594317 [Malus sylvestris]
MAQYQFLLLFLILGAAYVSVTMANEVAHQTLEQSTLASLSSNPAPSPFPPITRKLGKHNPSKTNPKSSDAPALSPRSAPSLTRETPETGESVSILEQEIHIQKHHHSMDKSVAGGGVILGGLATTFLVAIFCYIRATAKHKGSVTSTTGSSP